MTQTQKEKNIDIKYIVRCIVGLVLMFFFANIVPEWGGITELGVAMIGVFIGLLVLITITGQLIWPSCAAYIAVIFHGYMTAAAATSSFIGTTVIIQMVAVCVICSAMREAGTGEVIAKKLLTTKAIQGKPVLFSIVFLLTFLFADILLNSFGGIIFSFAVFDSIVDSLDKVSNKFNSIQIIYLVSFIIGIAYSFALLLIPKTVPWYAKFASITQAAWFILVIVVLSMVKVKGKPIMDAAKHFKEGANWGFITTVGIFSLLGGALTAEELGIKAWLTSIMGPVFSNMSWPLFVLMIVLVCTIVTNFFSNMATGVIVASLTAPFVAAFANQGINVSVVGAAIAYSSMFAFMTYAAAGPAPLLLGRKGITNKFIWSKGLLATVLYIIVATVVFSIMGIIL